MNRGVATARQYSFLYAHTPGTCITCTYRMLHITVNTGATQPVRKHWAQRLPRQLQTLFSEQQRRCRWKSNMHTPNAPTAGSTFVITRATALPYKMGQLQALSCASTAGSAFVIIIATALPSKMRWSHTDKLGTPSCKLQIDISAATPKRHSNTATVRSR